jgi:thioredoxin-related protein
MIKKTFFALGIATIIVVAQSFINNLQAPADELKGPVKWYTFAEAVALQKKNPKPIMVDVYTSWCGPCRMMSANTFGNEIIAKYLNDKFYPVKFNAETRDTVKFNGIYFANKNPEGTQRPVHDFAISILDSKLMYPSIVFLNEDIKKIQTITGYYKADQFEPIVKFFGSGKYKDTKWEDFQKTFVPEIKTVEPAPVFPAH